jgi:hypothetical protein
MTARRRSTPFVRGLLASALIAGSAAACAPAAAPDSHSPPIAAVYTRQCGKCHAPPQPRNHTRAQLEAVFARHKERAHLTPDEWAQMIDYLAVHDGATAPQKQ